MKIKHKKRKLYHQRANRIHMKRDKREQKRFAIKIAKIRVVEAMNAYHKTLNDKATMPMVASPQTIASVS